MTGDLSFLLPQWPAPPRVRAAFALRTGGVSAPPYASLNVGAHVGDAPEAVRENRRRLAKRLQLPEEPAWLEQVHGTQVVELETGAARATLTGDASCTREPGPVCVIQVADCLPVLLAVRDGSAVAAAHAGWRGLAAGVLEATVSRLRVPPAELCAWLGPAISARHFEVGAEVRAAFIVGAAADAAAFEPNRRGRWQCDLYGLARARLRRAGVRAISGGTWCTYADAQRFYSYRRDGQCGRMAALIWIA